MSKKRTKLDSWRGTNVVIDTGWGDGGKGKVVDALAEKAQLIVRFNGGPNAGHTVNNEYGEFKFHLIPAGIFNSEARSIISRTVAVNPFTLVREIEEVRGKNIEVSAQNLLVSKYAHLIMPWHIERDKLRERARGGSKIGTTGQGIGPLFADRTERVGLRIRDLVSPQFEALFDREFAWQEKLTQLMRADSEAPDEQVYDRELILEELRIAKKALGPMIADVLPVIWEAYDAGETILGEGAQGVLLDLNLGGYPYVTSSHPGLAGFTIATGIHQKDIQRVLGVTKAYQTRVGEGPMPTEILGKEGERLRDIGREYGATTGRPRRCGWLDLPALQYGVRVGGVNSIALTKLDVLDEFSELKICMCYSYQGKEYDTLPTADPEFMEQAVPVYMTMPGWMADTKSVRSFAHLPRRAQDYIMMIGERVGLPVEIISNGPERDAIITH